MTNIHSDDLPLQKTLKLCFALLNLVCLGSQNVCNIFREDSITNVQDKNKSDILAKANESISSHVCRPSQK